MTFSLDDATMIVACQEGDVKTVSSLLMKDTTDSFADNSSWFQRSIAWTDKEQNDLETPPIFIAVDYNQKEVVKLLLEHSKKGENHHDQNAGNDRSGADVNILDSNDYTPLSWASWNGNEEMVQLLIDYGARVDEETLDLAKEYNHSHIIDLLRKHIDMYAGLGEDIDEIMLKASRVGDVKKVQELIADGYDFNKWKGDDGSYQEYSPIYIAMKNGHVELIREFMAAGVEAELHSTHFHHPEEESKIKDNAELTPEQIAAFTKQMEEEEAESNNDNSNDITEDKDKLEPEESS